jgi:hypothetical protein
VTVLVLNNRMRRLRMAVWLLTVILTIGVLVGCGSMYTSIDNGVSQIPGQRIHVTTTVLRW